MDPVDRIERVLGYHQRTKHGYPNRYARSLGHLDWVSQPDPFRSYEGAPRIVVLDEVAVGEGRELEWALTRRGVIAPAPVEPRSIAQLFYDSLAISAWKEAARSRWPLRCNPSSGNLHPTEGYLLAGPIDGISESPALFHYAPRLHALEQRRAIPTDAWSSLARQLPQGAFVVGLTSIVWREAWKYGERAFRYCMHDVGHAIGAITIAARPLGWSVHFVEGLDADAMARLLAVDDQQGIEADRPDLLLAIEPRASRARSPVRVSLDRDALDALTSAPAAGAPNVLSLEHHDWPILHEVEEASRPTGVQTTTDAEAEPRAESDLERAATGSGATRALIRRRRSAVDMDASVSISSAAFFDIARTLLRDGSALDPLPWSPQIHPVFFVHRVDGLEPGLAILIRDPGAEAALRASIALAEDWVRLPGAPADLPLFAIAHGDAQQIARAVNCAQDIAADGAFAVAMLARFEPALREHGASFYRGLHWEAGLLGQLLYLEAEAHGVAATGIGCFFDDALHELLGIEDRSFHTLYGFTVGAPVHDPRIQTLPAYHHRAALLNPGGTLDPSGEQSAE